MTFWAYMLRCRDGSYYVGHSDQLDYRIGQHQSGEMGGYTSTRRPVELVWSADFPTRYEALEAERRIKGFASPGDILADAEFITVARAAARSRSA